MKKDKLPSSKAADLRRRAEERLKERQRSGRSKDGDQRAAEETQKLLQELEIHQIELEMQNEELIQTQNTLLEAMEKYLNLYDFSPVGYFSLTSEALIAEVNLTGSSILGMNRKNLINSHFHQFIAPKHQNHWNNHRHFFIKLQEEIERSNRYQHQLTMFLLDLDDFKLFNDTYGHLEGDGVLVKVAQIIRDCIRQTDSAFRFGGEEFIVILPETSIDKALILAERIRNETQQTFFINAPTTQAHLTCSIGLSQYQSQEDLQAFVKRVDQNMYQAKAQGKNQCCFL